MEQKAQGAEDRTQNTLHRTQNAQRKANDNCTRGGHLGLGAFCKSDSLSGFVGPTCFPS